MPRSARPAAGRVGIELELLAPPGQTRFHIAGALARATGGRVLYGLKHVVERVTPDGRPVCSLSLAARVLDADGAARFDLVDDVTLREHAAEPGEGPARGAPLERVVMDDVRLSKWLERRSFVAARPDVREALKPLLEVFGATHDEGRGTVLDPWGQVLAVVDNEPTAHARVCEIVTRPLPARGPERDEAVRAALAAAAGCAVPAAAALHVHVDAGPWRSTPALRALVLAWADRRDELLARLRPNPRCKKLGPFPADVVRVARECPSDLPFSTLAAALKLAGANKELDVNLLGVIEPWPVQPTLEVRCLPMSTDPAAVLASVDAALAVLDDIGGEGA